MEKIFKQFLNVLMSIGMLVLASDCLQEVPSLQPSEQATEIERPLANSTARQLIQAMPDKKVLLTMVDPKNLGVAESEFQQFPAVFYEENSQAALSFIPEQALQDAQLALQAYSNKHPIPSHIQLIPIQEPADFLKIAVKTAPGAGGKNSGCFYIEEQDENRQGKGPSGVDELFTKIKDSAYPWIMLCDQDLMRKAASTDIIPEQDLIRDFFQCGVNSAARCFIMKGATPTRRRYQEFMRGCPKTFTKDNLTKGAFFTSLGIASLGMILAPVTGGVSAIVGSGLGVGGTSAAVASDNLPSDIGPTPGELAKYLTSVIVANNSLKQLIEKPSPLFLFTRDFLQKGLLLKRNMPEYKRAEHRSYSDFGECASAIKTDMRVKDPVIVFFIYSATGMHYESVIGVSVDSRDSPVEFAIMNTNGAICKLHYSNMRMLMSNDFFTTSFLGGKYNIIRFFRD